MAVKNRGQVSHLRLEKEDLGSSKKRRSGKWPKSRYTLSRRPHLHSCAREQARIPPHRETASICCQARNGHVPRQTAGCSRQTHSERELPVNDRTTKFTGTTNGNGEIHEKDISRVGDHNGTLELPEAGLFYHITVGGLNPAHKAGETDGSHYDGGISGIQMRLKNLGYNPGKTDGTMSKETTDAIILFQTLAMKRPCVNSNRRAR